jgi:hypothetical protein
MVQSLHLRCVVMTVVVRRMFADLLRPSLATSSLHFLLQSVSPFLLAVLGFIAYWTMRPCGYCTTVVSGRSPCKL